MRSCKVVRASLTVNAKVATVLGSIPASSDTVESDGAADEAELNNVHKNKKSKKPPLKQFMTSNGNDIEAKRNDASIIGVSSESKRSKPTYSRTQAK
jgi:hypothetical protein